MASGQAEQPRQGLNMPQPNNLGASIAVAKCSHSVAVQAQVTILTYEPLKDITDITDKTLATAQSGGQGLVSGLPRPKARPG